MNAGYHGCDHAKYKPTGEGAVVTPLDYVKNVSLDPQINKTPQHANNRMVLNLISDNGFTGNLGVTAKDPELEKAIGRAVEMSSGIGIVGGAGVTRLDGLYYEFKEEREKGKPIVKKVWLLNVELSPASENAATDTDSITFGEYIYPITIYGETVKDSAGTDDYVDKDGNRLTCYMIISSPSDADYANFEKTVPVPKVAVEG